MSDSGDFNKPMDAETEARLTALARESLGGVEPSVATRLAAMRREAVAIAGDAAGQVSWLDRLLTPGGLVAAGAALSLVIAAWVALRPADDAGVLPLLGEPEIAVVQDLELLEELEFLAWLEEEAEEATDGAG